MDRSSDCALALLCRVGFEPDLSDELATWFAARGQAPSIASAQPGVVRVSAVGPCPRLAELIFARDLMVVAAELAELNVKDRVTPIAAALDALGAFGQLSVLAPDSDATKPLAPLLGALESRLRGRVSAGTDARAVVWMLAGTHALVGRPPASGGAAFAGGIPRLKFPREAPSRSTLKLDEAFQVLLTEAERHALLRSGGSAVDLGAAPGGWAYQLVVRQIRVTAIDNGRIDARLMDSGLVQHLREDGFRYRPPKPVDWLVCDMVEKPGKVAELIARWFSMGWCRAAVFNLKLPMKRRFEAWQQARQLLATVAESGFLIRARQLYHDREEITVAIVPGRGDVRPQSRSKSAPGPSAGATRVSRTEPRADTRTGARPPMRSQPAHPPGAAANRALRTDPRADTRAGSRNKPAPTRSTPARPASTRSTPTRPASTRSAPGKPTPKGRSRSR